MTRHAITVLGHDRPGIIAEATGRLAGLGLNLEDSTMTLLRGHFAMMLVCEGDAPEPDIEAALAPLTDDGTLTVTVRGVPAEPTSRLFQNRPPSWSVPDDGSSIPVVVQEEPLWT